MNNKSIIFKTALLKGAKGDAGEGVPIPDDGVIYFEGEGVPDGYEMTDAPVSGGGAISCGTNPPSQAQGTENELYAQVTMSYTETLDVTNISYTVQDYFLFFHNNTTPIIERLGSYFKIVTKIYASNEDADEDVNSLKVSEEIIKTEDLMNGAITIYATDDTALGVIESIEDNLEIKFTKLLDYTTYSYRSQLYALSSVTFDSIDNLYIKKGGTWVKDKFNNVAQILKNDSKLYRVLLSNDETDDPEEAEAHKSNKLRFDPSTSTLYIGKNSLNIGESYSDGRILLYYTKMAGAVFNSMYITAEDGITTNAADFDIRFTGGNTWDGTNNSLKAALATAGGNGDKIWIFKNGVWFNSDKMILSLKDGVLDGQELKFAGQVAGFSVGFVNIPSDYSNQYYTLHFKLKETAGVVMDVQVGRCNTSGNLNDIVNYGTDRIAYDTKVIAANTLYDMEINAGNLNEGVYIGSAWNSDYRFSINEIWIEKKLPKHTF